MTALATDVKEQIDRTKSITAAQSQVESSSSFERVIYVPQGRCARFVPETTQHGIKGLYTDGFSFCNILVGINHSKSKILLSHIDGQTIFFSPDKIMDELKWLGEDSDIFVFLRENDGESNYEQLANNYQKISRKRLSRIVLDGIPPVTVSGIYVGFEEENGNVDHPNIKRFSSNEGPKGLIHHPKERQFLTVQKVEELIGLRTKTRKLRAGIPDIVKQKQICVFDGHTWTTPYDQELKVDLSDKLTKQEMDQFIPDYPFFNIQKQVKELIKNIQKEDIGVGDHQDSGIEVSFHMECYLNSDSKMSCEAILIRNIEDEMAGFECYSKNTKEEDTYKSELKLCLEKLKKAGQLEPAEQERTIERLKALIQKDHTNGYIRDVSREAFKHLYYFDERKRYQRIETERKIMFEKAKEEHLRAITLYKAREFDKAHPVFLQAIKQLIQTVSDNDPNLKVICFNFGSNLYEMCYFREAYYFLNLALKLKNLQLTRQIKEHTGKQKNNTVDKSTDRKSELDNKKEQDKVNLCLKSIREYSQGVSRELQFMFQSFVKEKNNKVENVKEDEAKDKEGNGKKKSKEQFDYSKSSSLILGYLGL